MLKFLLTWWNGQPPSMANQLIAALQRPPLDFHPGSGGFNTPRIITDTGVMVRGVLWLPNKVLIQPEMEMSQWEERLVAAAYQQAVAKQQRLICLKAKEAL